MGLVPPLKSFDPIPPLDVRPFHPLKAAALGSAFPDMVQCKFIPCKGGVVPPQI